MTLRYFHTEAVFVGPKTDLGIGIHYDNPSEVGADRLVNGVAGFRATEKCPQAVSSKLAPPGQRRYVVAAWPNSAQFGPDFEVNPERDPELSCAFHLAFDQGARRIEARLVHLEEQLIMHLQHHPGPEAALLERPRHSYHRQLYQVGGAALNRGIDRDPFGLRTGAAIRGRSTRVDIGGGRTWWSRSPVRGPWRATARCRRARPVIARGSA